MTGRLRRVAATVVATLVVGLLVAGSAPSTADAKEYSDGNGASVQAPETVALGSSITVTGTGWTRTTPAGTGSIIAVKLDRGAYRHLDGQGETDPRTGDELTGSDLDIWKVIEASADGTFEIDIPLPTTSNSSGATPKRVGEKYTVNLLSGTLGTDDGATPPTTQDKVRAFPIAITVTDGSSPSTSASPSASPTTPTPSASPSASASPSPTVTATRAPASPSGTCSDATAVTLSAADTVDGRPTVPLGGSIQLTGAGFCATDGASGSIIAIKINDGAYSRKDTSVDPNKEVWQIIEAADNGTFTATVPVPSADDTEPAFAAGAYTLRLLTGTLKFGDVIRTIKTQEFVVTTGSGGSGGGTLPKPGTTPDPVDPVKDLVTGSKGGVTLTQTGSKLTITVPSQRAGDWVYPYAFGKQTIEGFDETAYEPFPTEWLQLSTEQTVSLDLADYNVEGTTAWRLSVQNRDGTLVGWAGVSTFTSADDDDELDSSDDAFDSTSDTLASTGGSRPAVLAVGVLLVAGGAVLLRRQRGRKGSS